MARILVIEDEPHMRRIIASNFGRAGHEVTEAAGVAEARSAVQRNEFEVVFVDQRMSDGEGIEVVTALREMDPTLSVVMLTAVATVELAVAAMRLGAFDFLTKPFEPEVLLAVARRAYERTALLRENTRLRREVKQLEGSSEIYGTSAAMSTVRATIARVAPTTTTVLITGETGTGKELVARAIHGSSPRAAKPFIAVNCAAFTESLLESELFGHEKGAFTGADRSRAGLFEAAHDGTLFLDEIGEMSLTAQAKLLRVLTDGQVMRVGSTQPRKVSVRVLAATHRDLTVMLEQGGFRQDLYYRLAIVPIHIPPLRERPEDIPQLCDVLSQQVARELKMAARSLAPAAVRNLRAYHFPGNIRELRNLIERAYILSAGDSLGPESFTLPNVHAATIADGGTLPAACLGCSAVETLPDNFDLAQFLGGVERMLIERMLAACGGTQAEAARRLGLSRSVLSYKVTKHGLRNEGG